jgi:hypothetical protein
MNDLELIGHRVLDDENIDIAKKLYRRLDNDDKEILKPYLKKPFNLKRFFKRKLVWGIGAAIAAIATGIGTGLGKTLFDIIIRSIIK